MGTEAVSMPLRTASLDPESIELVVCATATSESIVPTVASRKRDRKIGERCLVYGCFSQGIDFLR
jgi:3-oxoacyl-[acyl-carrier-protein] synthase III